MKKTEWDIFDDAVDNLKHELKKFIYPHLEKILTWLYKWSQKS